MTVPVLVDPQQIDPSHLFDADMARYLKWFSQAKAIPGQEILTPGEPERRMRAQRLASGVPLPGEVWESIKMTALEAGVSP